MKRMIWVWLSLMGMIVLVTFLHSDWSLENPWTVNALILTSLMLSIELGLFYYRKRMADMSETLKNLHSQTTIHPQEDHYIQPNHD